MESRPMPWSATLTVCGLLLGAAFLMASRSVALAADGAFQLVLVLATEDVWGLDERILGAWVHQAPVVLAVRAGVTDTHILSVLLGVGHFVAPALVWSLAMVLSRTDRVVCFTVAMVAGLASGATWFISVNEIVLAAPLTVLVAVLLWQPRPWRLREAVLAIAPAVVLVACYETAVVTGSILGAWAVWRAMRGGGPRLEVLGCISVAALSAASVAVALAGTRSGANPTHSQSFLYYVVSLEPWPFYVALAGIGMLVGAIMLSRDGNVSRVLLGLGSAALVISVLSFEPSAFAGLQVRGGVALAAVALEVFLFLLWIRGAGLRDGRTGPRVPGMLAVVPVVFVASMVVVNFGALRDWSRSLDAFRSEVDQRQGVVAAIDVLPPGRRAVLWGWTASSLSLLLRGDPNAAVLVDRDPSLVPFPPNEARSQLRDEFVWRQ